MAFNTEAATARYIDSLGAEELERAAQYTTGNHWLLLWGLVVSALITWLIVRSGILDLLQAKLDRRGLAARAFLIGTAYLLISAILSLPWTIYTTWWRQRAYDMSSQPIGDFLAQTAIASLLSALAIGLFLAGVYLLIRRTGRRWWIWSGGLTAFALSALFLVSPILVEPLFNKYQPVPGGDVRSSLIEMAEGAGIPADRIYMYDGSRQSNNFTANVSGVLGSARIAISDVAMERASLNEVRAVTGHEIGHYVLQHVWRSVAVYALLAILIFWLVDRLFPWFARRFGSNAAIGEPRGVPVLVFMLSLFLLLAMPITNALSRSAESEADAYSLRTVNEPDGLASALIKTAEYRYPRPGWLQELVFYSHPSVERRVRRAMEWKSAHPPG